MIILHGSRGPGGTHGPSDGWVREPNARGILADHSRIDPNRIALLGLSPGGQAALYAAMKRVHDSFASEGTGFAAFFATCPNCVTEYRDDGVTTGKRLL